MGSGDIYESERRTRKQRIDPKLKASGWSVVPFVSEAASAALASSAVEEYATKLGPADYIFADDGDLLGVVEAKKLTVGPQGVLPQAERYAKAVPSEQPYQGEFGVPFLYSTNGEEIWFHDVRYSMNRSRKVSGFHSVRALREMLERDPEAEFSALRAIPLKEGIRPYQVEANTAIEQAIASGQRKMLVTMATGTGKTLMTVNEIYRLMKSGIARRVLFLVDRRALAAQTVRAFASFEAEPGLKFDKIYPVYSQRFQQTDFGKDEKFDPNVMPNSLLADPKLGDAFVYVSTIQRMSINLFGRDAGIHFGEGDSGDEDASKLDIPIHAFDLIVADECHRGYSAKELSVWRNTLDWFDAVKVGLTATPAAHTMAYFEHLAYRYDYERAVREGYLVDYDVVNITSDVRMNGVFLQEGEQVDQVDPDTGARQLDLLEDERTFDASQVERSITAPESNRKILEEIKRYADEHEVETGRFPKTLIFAANDLPHTSHADQLVELSREVFGQGEGFASKITGRVDRPLQKIREFRNRPNPKIVVTVDLLTTGVDIPSIEFIVFLRPVKSRILFEQMLGRGTRRSTDLVPAKTHFVVFDCFDGTLLEYFRDTTGMTIEPPEGDGKTVERIVEEIYQNEDRDYNTRRLVKRLQRVDKNMSGHARELFARFIPDGDVGRFAEDLPSALREDLMGAMKVLRDADFLKLLANYPRPQRTFIVASGVADDVQSEWLIKAGIGKEYKPEDYLQLFQRFIEEHADEISAVGILQSRQSEWGAEPLRQLREKLNTAPEHFTEPNLQKAFQAAHHKALVDIISMVKNAATESSRLLTAEERVDAAIARVTADLDLTEDQRKWIDHIRQHLVQNLSIEREDFTDIPVLADRGGWGRADRSFRGRLTEILEALNRELVAV
jgi:type I restriction enzyme R subunit